MVIFKYWYYFNTFMTVKTIKNVDEGVWYKFKNLAVKNRVGMGELLGKMVNTYERDATKFWKEIFEGERLLSEKEAQELQTHVKVFRKEYGFRQ
ncbi:hypothetical protein HY837_00305 [archaeon]|nr:hypothetical protein [archaeon]